MKTFTTQHRLITANACLPSQQLLPSASDRHLAALAPSSPPTFQPLSRNDKTVVPAMLAPDATVDVTCSKRKNPFVEFVRVPKTLRLDLSTNDPSIVTAGVPEKSDVLGERANRRLLAVGTQKSSHVQKRVMATPRHSKHHSIGTHVPSSPPPKRISSKHQPGNCTVCRRQRRGALLFLECSICCNSMCTICARICTACSTLTCSRCCREDISQPEEIYVCFPCQDTVDVMSE